MRANHRYGYACDLLWTMKWMFTPPRTRSTAWPTANGFPYLTMTYTIEKMGSNFKQTGTLLPMTPGDGPHYANNVALAGEGDYRLTYHFEPPSKAGFIRHIDKATGVPDWWQPFSETWTFHFPSKPAE